MRPWICALVVGIILRNHEVRAAEDQEVERGPVHEAYVAQHAGTVILQTSDREPPAALEEQQADTCALDTDWIPGYWIWSASEHDFIWVSGVWRRPPPGLHWISGFWKQVDDRWVRVRGFWSAAPESELHYLAQMPPDPLMEKVVEPPSERMFWMPGYWAYSDADHNFRWYGGQWEPIDDNWVFVPATWLWRPGGYIFLPSYWDYPVEKRGCIYPAFRITSGQTKISHLSRKPLEPDAVVEALLPTYPDYGVFFQQHYLTHRNFWDRYYGTPPWWGWPLWWTIPYSDQWAVFWWWSHPGYPQPSWVAITTSTRIWPPTSKFVRQMETVTPPPIVTSRGVLRPRELLQNALHQDDSLKQGMPPILPAELESTQQLVQDQGGPRPLRPSGRPPGPGEKIEVNGPKPDLTIEVSTNQQKSWQAKLPPKPANRQPPPIQAPGVMQPGQPSLDRTGAQMPLDKRTMKQSMDKSTPMVPQGNDASLKRYPDQETKGIGPASQSTDADKQVSPQPSRGPRPQPPSTPSEYVPIGPPELPPVQPQMHNAPQYERLQPQMVPPSGQVSPSRMQRNSQASPRLEPQHPQTQQHVSCSGVIHRPAGRLTTRFCSSPEFRIVRFSRQVPNSWGSNTHRCESEVRQLTGRSIGWPGTDLAWESVHRSAP